MKNADTRSREPHRLRGDLTGEGDDPDASARAPLERSLLTPTLRSSGGSGFWQDDRWLVVVPDSADPKQPAPTSLWHNHQAEPAS